MPKMKREIDFVELSIRYLSGSTTADENKSLAAWLHVSKENRISFNAIRDAWLTTSQVDPLTIHAISEESASFTSDPTIDKVQRFYTFRSNSLVKLALRVAAVFIAALFIGAMGYRFLFGNEIAPSHSHLTIIEAPLGSKAVATLPDGTKVWLNAGSKLSYTAGYDIKNRDLNLTGEAYFDVKQKPSKPFVVHAGNLSIKALGTSFNVKAYPEDQSIVTTLVKGKVVIAGKDKVHKEFTIDLKPNESVTYYKEAAMPAIKSRISSAEDSGIQTDGNKIAETQNIKNIPAQKLNKVNTALFTSWKDENWIIENQQLESLSRDFERRYNIKIELASQNIGNYHFTGTIQNETIEQIMVILRHTIPLKYDLDRGIIKIYEDPLLVKEFELKSSNK